MRLQLAPAPGLLLTAAALALCTPASALADDEWELTSDTQVYTDTDNVQVITPQVGVHRKLDDAGGEVGARVVVDYISAASVDVVSQATNRFSEVRTEANLAVARSAWGMLPSLSYRVSHEPDYVSHGGRLGLTRRLGSSDTTLSLGYGLSYDSVGMSGSPSSAFSESLISHAADVSLTQVLGPLTVVRLVYSFTGQDGYMEKPYRLVPLFDPAMVGGVVLDGDNVDDYRLPGKIAESVPDRRYRHAVALRGLRYVPSLQASLRLDYRLYGDSWGVWAHTVEPAVTRELGDDMRLSTYGRFYRQSAASFWRRSYELDAGMVPAWRTVDKGLSPFSTYTAGARFEMDFGPLTGYAEANAMYSQFRDYLFLDHRLALIGQIGVRWTP